jgi:hypothetical protein
VNNQILTFNDPVASVSELQSIALNIRENQKSAAKLSHQELTANIAAKNALD